MASRSLGTLTLDLIARTGLYEGALDKSGRTTKKWTNQAKKDLKTLAKGFAGLSIGAAAGLVAITKNAIDSAREIENLSKVANTSTNSFQKITYAASRYGVAQDKVADILKDTSDKIGDFLQTGGGPLADFFENIAPRVGVTAEQFRNLSGDKALGLYVDSLEKANVSQNEMTFFMEAIASDATLLLPLLKNNGKELGELSKQAENFGAVVSDVELGKLNAIRDNIDELKGVFKGVSTEVAFATLPAIERLTDIMSDPKSIEAAKSLALGISTAFGVAAEAIVKTIEVVQFLGEEFAAITVGINSDDIVRLEQDADKIRSILNDGGVKNFGERIRFFGPDGFVEFYSDDELKAELSKLDGAISDYYKNLTNRPKPPVSTDIAPDLSKVIAGPTTGFGKDLNEVNEYIKALELQAKLFGRTTIEQELYKLSLKGANEEQLKAASSALQYIDAQEKQKETLEEISKLEIEAAKKLADEQKRINEEAQQIAESLKSEEQMIEESYLRRRDIVLRNTEVTGAAQTELLERLEKDRNERLKQLEGARAVATLQQTEDLFGGLSALAKQFAGEESRIFKVLFAVEKAAAIARSIVAIQTGIAQAAALPFPANLGAMAAVASATAGIVSTIKSAQIDGQAHDGLMTVPKTGTYLLERGERVTTEKTSAKLDRTLDNVQSQVNAGGNGPINLKAVFVQDIRDAVLEIMKSEGGERVTMGHVETNRTRIKTYAQG